MATLAMLVLFALPALAQKVTVTGTVTDQTGEALIGASVMEKGTTNGTSTDSLPSTPVPLWSSPTWATTPWKRHLTDVLTSTL